MNEKVKLVIDARQGINSSVVTDKSWTADPMSNKKYYRISPIK